MRWSEFIICAAFFVIRCSLFFNCCEGRASLIDNFVTSPSLLQSSVDCGSFQSSNGPLKPITRSGMSLVSSLLRSNFFASSFKREYICWRSSDVIEVYTYKNACSLTRKVTVEFNTVNMSDLESIKGAVLTLTLVYPADMNDISRDQFGPLQVLGTASGLDGTPQKLTMLTEEKPEPGVNNQEVFNFDALNLLRAVYQHQQNKVAAENQEEGFGNIEPANEKIFLKFDVSRSCDNVITSNCPKILDTDVHMPSLRVFLA